MDDLRVMRFGDGLYIVGLKPSHATLQNGEVMVETDDPIIRNLYKKLFVVTEGVPPGVRWAYIVRVDEMRNIVYLELALPRRKFNDTRTAWVSEKKFS